MLALLSAVVSAVICAAMVRALFPLMRRYALARPNARSSHRVPTPQGGGIAVVAATLATCAGALWLAGAGEGAFGVFGAVAVATVLLAAVGAVDDIRPLPVSPRLALQGVGVALVVIAAAETGRVLPDEIPLGVEIGLAALAGLWFVNLTNFMDGLDWLTVAAVVPLAATIAVLGLGDVVGTLETALAAALLGAMLGFSPFNKPAARLFLGDVGSLPIGLLVAFLLYGLAASGHLVAAILLPLYSCTDATLTLARRALRGETVWQAHRSHFYQRATDNGLTPLAVSGTIFVANAALAALALTAVALDGPIGDLLVLAAGAAVVAGVLVRFSRGGATARSAR
ncbi:glycosyltransferase family 4 protein [Salinarimonas sp.]|uniref:MraY family glycosyltransferase n=1 Tax=Salinarimonas sp. TaxID=2766526 RepID=UPI0032D943D3